MSVVEVNPPMEEKKSEVSEENKPKVLITATIVEPKLVLKEKVKKPKSEKQIVAIAAMREKLAEYRKTQKEAKAYELEQANKKREEILAKAVEETKAKMPDAKVKVKKVTGTKVGQKYKKQVKRQPPPKEEATSATSESESESDSESDSGSESEATRKYVRKADRRLRAVKQIDEKLKYVNPYFKSNMSVF